MTAFQHLPGPHDERTPYYDFASVQTAAGIHRQCDREHEPSSARRLYGSADVGRRFAIPNAEASGVDAMQKLMRHKCYKTMKWYINMANGLNKATNLGHIPMLTTRSTEKVVTLEGIG